MTFVGMQSRHIRAWSSVGRCYRQTATNSHESTLFGWPSDRFSDVLKTGCNYTRCQGLLAFCRVFSESPLNRRKSLMRWRNEPIRGHRMRRSRNIYDSAALNQLSYAAKLLLQ